MADSFAVALPFTLRNEGLWADNANDRGGATMRGITYRAFVAWRLKKKRPAPSIDDLRNISMDEVTEFYRSEYWDVNLLGQLTSTITATTLFDIGVLNGPRVAAVAAQTVAASLTKVSLTPDGLVGPKTIAAINACNDRAFIRGIQRRQAKRYLDICVSDATQCLFYDGWIARTIAYTDLFLAPPPLATT